VFVVFVSESECLKSPASFPAPHQRRPALVQEGIPLAPTQVGCLRAHAGTRPGKEKYLRLRLNPQSDTAVRNWHKSVPQRIYCIKQRKEDV